jgi:acyl carrier protein
MVGVFESVVKSIVAEILGVKLLRITAHKDFMTDLGANDAQMVAIVRGIENRLNLKIADDDLSRIRTLAQAVDYIAQQTSIPYDSGVKEIVAMILKVDSAKVTPYADFVDDLGADSMNIVSIIMEIEDKFKIQISDSDIPKIKNLSQAADYLANKLEVAAPKVFV